MYNHEQLTNAVRAAGRDGRTFSVKDIRSELGFETRDKKELSRFRRRLRAFEKEVGDQLEKVGNNSYRLKAGAFESAAAAVEAQVGAAKKEARDPVSGVFETLPTVAELGAVAAEAPLLTAAPLQPSAAEITAHAVVAEPSTPLVASAPQPPAEQVVHIAEQPEEAPTLAAHVAQQPTAATAPTRAMAEQSTATHAPAERSATNGAPKAAVAAFAVHQPATNSAKAQPIAKAAYAPPPSAAVAPPAQNAAHSVSRVQRAKQLATTILSGALAASAAVSGRVRQRSHNLREQLWSCIQAVPTKQHAIARLRGWAEGLRPLSSQVRHQLNVLRQRVRRA